MSGALPLRSAETLGMTGLAQLRGCAGRASAWIFCIDLESVSRLLTSAAILHVRISEQNEAVACSQFSPNILCLLI